MSLGRLGGVLFVPFLVALAPVCPVENPDPVAPGVIETAFLEQEDASQLITGPDPEAVAPPSKKAAVFLTRAELEEDLDEFQSELEDRFAYLRYNQPDYAGAIRAIRDNLSIGMSLDDFDIELTKVMALFIDGHSVVLGGYFPEGYLPFRLERIGNRYIGFWPDRRNFVAASFPYVTRIDGMDFDEWRNVLQVMIPKGSPSYITYYTLRYLEYIRFARSLAGIDDPDVVEVELESRDGSRRVTTFLEIADEPPIVETWPDSESGFIDGNIGYLRITRWLEDAPGEIATWMPRFAGTRGLIIDLRDNRGGSRNNFLGLYPYFVSASDPPRVANVAKYRLSSRFPYDYLAGRNLYRETWSGWSPAERSAISDFMETFEPEWVVPQAEFSDWHFWLLSKKWDPEAYDYPEPIIFLMDKTCWSASDVVLSSVKGMANVTLIGEPSIGASGAMIATTLQNSGIELYMSSMASFQNTGQLYETNGVLPDIYREPRPEYYLRNGVDTVLEYAVRRFAHPRRAGSRVAP